MKHMANLAVTPVVAQCTDAIDVTHQAQQVGAVCLHDHVVVIAHQAMGAGRRLKAVEPLGQHRQPFTAVNIVFEDSLAPVTTRCNVIKRTFKFQSDWPGHFARLTDSVGKRQDLTLACESTVLSGPLKDAINSGLIRFNLIPPPK